MVRRPPGSTRTDTLFPYTTLFRSVDAPVDGNAAIPVGTGPGVGIAQGIEPARGILGPVPVVEAMDRHDALGAEPHEERMLVAAGSAPGGKDIDQPDFALRSEERRVGKKCVRPGRSGWWPYH